MLRKGSPIDAQQARKKLGNKSFEQLIKEARNEPFAESFKKLDVYEALDVYAIANEKERRFANIVLGEKLENKFYQLSLPTAKPYDVDHMKEYMKMYGITNRQAEMYLRNYWIRQNRKSATAPRNPQLGRGTKIQILKEHLK